jgi:DNA-binding PadR family transcriptional regulator
MHSREPGPDRFFFFNEPVPPFPPFGLPPFAMRRRGMRGRFGRARRGDVRAGILALLAEESMHGYQIIQELESRSGGWWRPSPGSVYPTLQLLEDEGLVVHEETDGKRVYALTGEGKARAEALAKEAKRLPWEGLAEGADHTFLRLGKAASQVGAAAMQTAHAGSEQQVGQVLEILDDARRRIYSVLAEGDDAPS